MQVTSGAPQPMNPGTGQQARPQQNVSSPCPASSAEPVVIITSSTPPSMGLKLPAAFEAGPGGCPSPRQQQSGSNNAVNDPNPGLDEDRCPSPIPVTLDDFRSAGGEEEGVDDLQGLELPWASRESQSPASSPAQKENGPASPSQSHAIDRP